MTQTETKRLTSFGPPWNREASDKSLTLRTVLDKSCINILVHLTIFVGDPNSPNLLHLTKACSKLHLPKP
jgi:hypothetical protein